MCRLKYRHGPVSSAEGTKTGLGIEGGKEGCVEDAGVPRALYRSLSLSLSPFLCTFFFPSRVIQVPTRVSCKLLMLSKGRPFLWRGTGTLPPLVLFEKTGRVEGEATREQRGTLHEAWNNRKKTTLVLLETGCLNTSPPLSSPSSRVSSGFLLNGIIT
ncbi:hypothetical protein LY76DRAFT_413482 [Colletotrichum caudatum]|nr:hypothetical protein LY76DRAFT_413482 [Colletotrichum caudatum]